MKNTEYQMNEYTIVKMSDGEEILFIDAPDKTVRWIDSRTVEVESSWFGRHRFTIGEHTPFADNKSAIIRSIGHCSRLERA